MQANKEQFALVKKDFELPAFMNALKNVVPNHKTMERIVRVALDSINRNPLLLECTRTSLMRSVLDAGQLGLEPSSVQGMAYLVPFKNKKGEYECQMIIGYMGMIELATRSDRVLKIEPSVVYDFDEYSFERGSKSHVHHRPMPWDGATIDQRTGEPVIDHIVAFYAVATLSNGATQFEWLWKSQVDAIKARSKAQHGPWQEWYVPMGLKSPIRRLFKFIPRSAEITHALEMEDRAEGLGDFIDVTSVDIDVDAEKSTGNAVEDHIQRTRRGRPPKAVEPAVDVTLPGREPQRDIHEIITTETDTLHENEISADVSRRDGLLLKARAVDDAEGRGDQTERETQATLDHYPSGISDQVYEQMEKYLMGRLVKAIGTGA